MSSLSAALSDEYRTGSVVQRGKQSLTFITSALLKLSRTSSPWTINLPPFIASSLT